eukprot:Em0020g798a
MVDVAPTPSRPKFALPQLQDNPVGWGPCEVPEQFKDTPYQPFSKDDRLGKVADWSGNVYQDRRAANKYGSLYGLGGQAYVYHHEEDETSFQLVDTGRIPKPMHQKSRPKFSQLKIKRDREKRDERRMGGRQPIAKKKGREWDRQRQQQQRKRNQFGYSYERGPVVLKPRLPSVQVSTDWDVLEEIDFARLAKLNYQPEEPRELHFCGSLGYYDVQKEKKISPRNPLPLQYQERICHKVTTTDDPIIRKLAKQGEGKVFATDTIVATLMACARSQYSWDIVVTKVGDLMFFDKREDSRFDMLTVDETTKDPPQEEGMNSPDSLSTEATYINQTFSQQMLTKDPPLDLSNPNPFIGEGDLQSKVGSVAYRYLRWNLKDNSGLVVRCEYDAVVPQPGGGKSYINIRALNELGPKKASSGIDWRKKFEQQKGAILATELKNNSFKIAKWALTSILAQASYIKFGYVSRIFNRDNSKHEILGVQQVKPLELATQMTLDVPNAWGVLLAVIEACRALPVDEDRTAKYLVLKDPNKPVVRIFRVPKDAFEGSDGSDESDGGGSQD